MEHTLKIPLFPLNVVLFPYSKLPLFIYEQKYKKLVNFCLKEDQIFGINLVTEQKIHMIGCTAKVAELTNKFKTGEMNIVTLGIQRYQLGKYEMSSEGYFIGEVQVLEENNLNYDLEKMEKAVESYNHLIEFVYKGSLEAIDLTDLKWKDEKRSITFYMAQKCGLSLVEKQALLEINNESERLNYIIKYFDDVIPKLEEAGRVMKIIKSDGYLPN